MNKYTIRYHTVNEYQSIQRKLKRFCLEEQASRGALILSSSRISQNPGHCEPIEHAEIVRLAEANQKKQAKPKPKPRGRSEKTDIARPATFAKKSKEASLKQSLRQTCKSDYRKLLYSTSSENRSFLKITPKNLKSLSTVRTFNIR